MDSEEYVRRKRAKREDNEKKTSTLSEIREKAKNEQKDQRHRHSDRRSDERERRHRDRHERDPERADRRVRVDDRAYGRRGERSDDSSRHKSYESESKDRNIDSFKSEEFWSKESKIKTKTDEKEVKEKQKPNFETTGKLAEDTNTFNGVVVKYNQPTEARKPKKKWRLYPFKGSESLSFIPIHRQSAYLLGRDRKVADIPIDHPSCSKQHSVIQYRLVEYQREDQTVGKRVRPYIIDLDSSNGTFVNNQKIDAKRYYELFEKDVIKFGFSTREYVLLDEQSKDDTDDEDSNALTPDIEVKTEPNPD